MKNILIIFSIAFVLSNCIAFCQTNYYYTPNGYRRTYSPYQNPLGYSRYQNNLNNKKAIEKIRQRRNINRARRILNNVNTSLNNTRYPKGNLTGYSVPINQNALIQPNSGDIFNKNRLNSPTCNQDLFSDGNTGETYYNNGEYFQHSRNTSGKTGVTIIYD